MRAARTILFFFLPVAAALVLGILANVGIFGRIDGRAFDQLLRLAPAIPASPVVLLVDIDVPTGSLAGLVADGLVTFKELGARSVVLDLPLAQKSPPSLDPSALRQALPNALDREFSRMQENVQSLFDAIRSGSVRPRDASRYVSDLVGLVGQAKQRLFSAAMGIERDDDALLGQAAAFFGRTYVPAGLLSHSDVLLSSDLVELSLQRQSIPVSVIGRDPSLHADGLRPSVLPVVRGARGGGFPTQPADRDNVVRRTPLLAEIGGQHIGQLAFAALLDLLGGPAVEVSPGRILLRGETGGRSIPVDESGEMLLRWPRAFPEDGFRHLEWSTILQAERLEDTLVAGLRDLDARGYLTYLRSPDSLLDVYEEGARLSRGMLASGSDSEVERWRTSRERFFALCAQFLGGDAEARIVADADRELQGGALSDEEKSIVRAQRDRVPAAFVGVRQVLVRAQAVRASLRESMAGSLCIVSQEPQAGAALPAVTPFDIPATDALVSAALVSTVLSDRFLREAPGRVTLLAAAVLALLLSFALLRMKPLLSLVTGVAVSAAVVAALGLMMGRFGYFMPPSLPFASLLFTTVALASLKLAWKRGASRMVRAAFAGRVSTESLQVIDSSRALIAPEGSLRHVTVVCIAERGMAADSSSLDPTEVIRRLRTDRAAVRESILGLGGMLAGHGGGQALAFFGAPVETADHARRACLSALRVRALERELVGGAAWGSRIGIDSGECIAGFFGERRLPDFSLAGPPVQLAARLEGLNAVLGTTIVISENARGAAGPGFQVRRLGLVSGDGTGGGVSVYELCAEMGAGGALPDQLVSAFEEGLALYERGDFPGALTVFSRVLAAAPGDGPSTAYAQRCRWLAAGGEERVATSLPW